MERCIYTLQEASKRLKSMIQVTEEALEDAPCGSLKIRLSGGNIQYYHRISGNPERVVYIPKSEIELAQALAQKDYHEKLLKLLKKKLRQLGRFLARYPIEEITSVYDGLTPERQALVRPLILSDDAFIREWETEPYEGLGFFPDDKSAYYTEKGERVRSKTEVIIANALYHAGIPYKYECPLNLNGKIIYPDFTILDIRTRRVVYFEHFGKMDDPDYRAKAMQKINLYASASLTQGKGLLYTMEDASSPLDTRSLSMLIRAHFQTADPE